MDNLINNLFLVKELLNLKIKDLEWKEKEKNNNFFLASILLIKDVIREVRGDSHKVWS